LPSWLGLAEGHLRVCRWPELEKVLSHLEQLPPPGPTEAALFRARAQLARREFIPAKVLLTDMIAQEPQALEPRVLLSQVLLQEGHDLDAAEGALQEVLTFAPDHAEAHHHLTLLRQQRRITPAP
jgi:hypothetical protein